MKNRLEIIEEVYGETEWSAAALMSIVRCMEIAQDEARKQIEQSITDPENQPSQYGTVQYESACHEIVEDHHPVAKALDFETAIWVLDKLWDKKSGKEITRRWAMLLSKYRKEESDE